MSSLGIYFGSKMISFVETKGKKLISNANISQSKISSGDLEEKVQAETKSAGIIYLLREELQKNKIEVKEANICLSGKDLIIRNFEMPDMPHDELQGAINFEVKKYIPFKVEDLIADFQIKFDRLSHTNLVLYIGIKRETLDKYISMLTQLNINIKEIEYSAFSILRCVKLSGLNDRGVIGILAVDLKGGDEANFAVLENGFPLFSRDIILSGEADELGRFNEPSTELILEKLKTEIRVSLDYYHRKFPTKNTKKIYIFSDQEFRSNLDSIMAEIGLSVQFVDVSKHITSSQPYSLNFIKALSCSLSASLRTNINVNLLAAKDRAARVKEKSVKTDTISFIRTLKLDQRVIGLSLTLCMVAYFFGAYRTSVFRRELNMVRGLRPPVNTVNPDSSYEELTSQDLVYKNKLLNLNSFINKGLYFTEILNTLPTVISKGSWLTGLSYNKSESNIMELVLEGMVKLNEPDKEFEAVNQIVLKLKENPHFSKNFKRITISSVDHILFKGEPATSFLISCRNY